MKTSGSLKCCCLNKTSTQRTSFLRPHSSPYRKEHSMSIVQTTRRPPATKPVCGDTTLNGSHPLVHRIVICLLFNEGAGPRVRNLITPIGDANMIGTPGWVPGKFGGRAAHDGTGNGMVISAYPDQDGLFQSGNPTTFVVWARDTNGVITLWEKVDSGGTNIVWNMNMNVNLQMSLFSTNGGRFTPIGAISNDANFHQYAMVYDGSSDWKTLSAYQFYFDGQPCSMSSSQNNPQTQRSDTGGKMFVVSASTSWDQVLAWKNRALTQRDIWDLYVNPYCFMAPNQRSRIYQAGGLTPHRKPFIFSVT